MPVQSFPPINIAKATWLKQRLDRFKYAGLLEFFDDIPTRTEAAYIANALESFFYDNKLPYAKPRTKYIPDQKLVYFSGGQTRSLHFVVAFISNEELWMTSRGVTEIKNGDVVSFFNFLDADHFVKTQRALYLGTYKSLEILNRQADMIRLGVCS